MTKSRKKEEEKVKEKQGQSWSIDLIIGVIIFMLVIAVFYALLTSKNEPTIEELQGNADVITTKLTQEDASSPSNILVNGIIDDAKYDGLCDMPYEDVKAILGIEQDFCIYLEDENGNIIPCGTTERTGIGNSEDINLSTHYKCGEQVV